MSRDTENWCMAQTVFKSGLCLKRCPFTIFKACEILLIRRSIKLNQSIWTYLNHTENWGSIYSWECCVKIITMWPRRWCMHNMHMLWGCLSDGVKVLPPISENTFTCTWTQLASISHSPAARFVSQCFTACLLHQDLMRQRELVSLPLAGFIIAYHVRPHSPQRRRDCTAGKGWLLCFKKSEAKSHGGLPHFQPDRCLPKPSTNTPFVSET